MRIKINDRVQTHLSEDEYKYLLLLQVSQLFAKKVKYIRKKLAIPLAKDGETILSFPTVPDQKLLHKLSRGLMLELGLPFQLLGAIESLVQWGEILKTTLPIMVLSAEHQYNRKLLYSYEISVKPQEKRYLKQWFSSNKEIIQKNGNEFPFVPIILINKKLTREQLMQSITENWDKIEQAQEEYLSSYPYKNDLSHIPVKEITEWLEMNELRQSGLKYKEIATKFGIEKHSVRKKFYRIRKLLNKLGINN